MYLCGLTNPLFWFQVNLGITPSARVEMVALAEADADLPPTFGETVVTGYGSVVLSEFRHCI